MWNWKNKFFHFIFFCKCSMYRFNLPLFRKPLFLCKTSPSLALNLAPHFDFFGEYCPYEIKDKHKNNFMKEMFHFFMFRRLPRIFVIDIYIGFEMLWLCHCCNYLVDYGAWAGPRRAHLPRRWFSGAGGPGYRGAVKFFRGARGRGIGAPGPKGRDIKFLRNSGPYVHWYMSYISGLLLIITLRFTCGEREICSTTKKSQNVEHDCRTM